MEWIEEIQRSLGAPVVAFAQSNWLILLLIGAVAMLWVFGRFSSRGDGSAGVFFSFGDSDDGADGDSGGDGGGGDGGGGGD
jgi:hypothetical protein